MAELFFDDERMGMQDPRYNNRLQNESFSDLKYQDQGTYHPPLGFPRNTSNLNYNIHQDPPVNWRDDININTRPQYPTPFNPAQGNIPYAPMEGENIDKQGFNFSDFGISGILKALGGTRSPENQKAYEAITASQGDTGWGTYEGNPYQIRDGKIYSDLDKYGSHFDSWKGSKSIKERDQKKIDWALGRLDKFKDVDDDKVHTGISKRLFDVLVSRGVIDESGNRVITPAGVDKVIDTTTSRWKPDAGATTYTGPQTYDYSPSQAARTEHYTERPGTRDGYIDPGNIPNSPWARAEGGRIGYANGEFVDEDVNIQGPGFDVNENIAMTSGGGEEDILEQLVAKYIQAGFPPDQAQEMAMQELQQMVAQSGQGEGIASLV